MLTALYLQNKDLQKRMLREALVPLTKITLLCGPNGSGKSTIIDAFQSLVLDNRKWTEKTAPVLPEGHLEGNVLFFSMERDNPRTSGGRFVNSLSAAAEVINAQYQSHGQSNYGMLQEMFEDSRYAAMVLDEPESALDMDGQLRLRQTLLKTDKQVILATHSPLLLSLAQTGNPDITAQAFGKDADYAATVTATYRTVLEGGKPPAPKKRLPSLGLEKTPKFAGIRKRA